MHHFVYKTTNRINGKIYVGAHKTESMDDEYMGSGKILLRAIEKYGIKNFERKILTKFDNADDMYKMEAILVNEEFVADKNTYNIKCGGFGGFDYINKNGLGLKWGVSPSDETKRKISKSKMGQKHSKKSREKMKQNNWGRRDPEGQREHLRWAASLPKSEEHKRKISKSLKGKRKGEKQPIIKCPHCETEGGTSNMKRWHFDNCKLRA